VCLLLLIYLPVLDREIDVDEGNHYIIITTMAIASRGVTGATVSHPFFFFSSFRSVAEVADFFASKGGGCRMRMCVYVCEYVLD